MKKAGILIGFIVIWFLFFGIRLIGYFSSVADKGFRATECGTDGCSNLVLTLSTIWTFAFFIQVPIAVIALIYKKMK